MLGSEEQKKKANKSEIGPSRYLKYTEILDPIIMGLSGLKNEKGAGMKDRGEGRECGTKIENNRKGEKERERERKVLTIIKGKS